MKFKNLIANKGEKAQGFIDVINSDMKMPITIINGVEDGETILIMGGIHSAEYVGIQSAIELASEINPDMVKGSIIILPLVNTDGFANRTISMVYEDNKNLNRVFPGDKDGTLADKIAYTIVNEIYPKINYLLDLHGGDAYEQLTDYVYAQGNAPKNVVEKSKEIASYTNMEYMVLSSVATGGAYNYAGSVGIPAILLERGNLGVWTKEEVEKTKKDVKNILAGLKFIKEEVKETKTKTILNNVIYKNAPYHGCFYPTKQAGDTFQKGELLGEIKDYFGNVLYQEYAEFEGIILYQVASLTVLDGGPMITYAELKQRDDLEEIKNIRYHF